MNNKLIERAKAVKAGDRIVFRYERPLEVLKKKTTRSFTKSEIISAEIVEGSYFQQIMETNGIHKEQEIDLYEKVEGIVYQRAHTSEQTSPLYVRITAPKSKITTRSFIRDDETGAEVDLEDIKDILRASELKPSRDIQDRLEDCGHTIEEKILSLTYKAERIKELEVE